MIKHLYDLLSFDHLLNISIDHTNVPLLFRKKVAAALAHSHYHRQHQAQAENRYQKQERAGNDHHRHNPYKGQRTGNQAGKTVVHDLCNSFNIIGIAAHQFAMGMGIKITQG